MVFQTSAMKHYKNGTEEERKIYTKALQNAFTKNKSKSSAGII